MTMKFECMVGHDQAEGRVRNTEHLVKALEAVLADLKSDMFRGKPMGEANIFTGPGEGEYVGWWAFRTEDPP